VITDDEESTAPVKFLRGHGEINIIPLWKWLLLIDSRVAPDYICMSKSFALTGLSGLYL